MAQTEEEAGDGRTLGRSVHFALMQRALSH